MHPIGDRWRVVRSPGAGSGGSARLVTEGNRISRARKERGLLAAREGKLGAGATGSGRKRGCVFLGVWGFHWRAEEGVRGKRRGFEGVLCRDRVKTSLESKSRGWECFWHKHLRRKQTKAWNEREAAHAWKMGQRREGDSSGT